MLSRKITLTAFLCGVGVAAASAGTPLYQTGFETNGDPSGASFVLGPLNGQGAVGSFTGWQVLSTVGGSDATVVNSSTGPVSPESGDNYVHQDQGTEITATLPHASTRMLVRAFHNGVGATLPTTPNPGVDAAAIVAFRSVDASNYKVAAYDGDSSSWQENGSAPNLATGQWHQVLVGVDYNNSVFHVTVAGEPYLDNLGFFNNTVSQFNGFRASTTVGANIDTVGFFPSNGDYDGDGFSDDIEMLMSGGDALDSGLNPPFGDVNGDSSVDLLDAVLWFRTLTFIGSDPTGLNLNWDINGDGTPGTLDDSATLLAFLRGDAAVPVIPPVI